MKQIVFKSIYILTLIISLGVVSCVDDFPYRDEIIPEGDGILSATVTFTPINANNLGETRTEGNKLNSIESLCVIVYDKDKNFIKKYTQGGEKKELLEYKTTDISEKQMNELLDETKDRPSGEQTDETKTAQATFQIPDLPYGQYFIFAVANMGDLSGYDIETVEKLQKISLSWDPENVEKNNQMFGYFTTDQDMESQGFEYENLLTFTGRSDNSKIHAWLKRAASKVTVAYDPSGLNQGVTIYIKSVTIRDIPKTCLLGADNTPGLVAENETAPDPSTVLYNHLSSYNNPDYKNPTEVDAENTRLWYNADGVVAEKPAESTTTPTFGLRLDNSVRSAIPVGAHNVDEESLFFYENNQNPYLEKQSDYKGTDGKTNNKYNKQPQKEGTDAIGQTIHDANDGRDFKDRIPYGTYIEVEAYYTSSNPANPGEGSIKYRFMLGKDTSFDYNAQRNYHYKVTLGFNGWANDPDWHIDYVITTPAIEVPPVFRVSYLYQQMSELPIKIVGNIQYLTVTITENNWAPYDPNSDSNQTITLGTGDNEKKYLVPKGEIESSPSLYQFQWNEAAFTNFRYLNPDPDPNDKFKDSYPANLPPGQERPQFGFLALHLPTRATTIITGGHSLEANNSLIDYWKEHLEGERRFSSIGDGQNDFELGEHPTSWGDRNPPDFTNGNFSITNDDKFRVDPVLSDNGVAIENQRILMLPVWTRTKTLIEGSGFSGNNPYEPFERKAVVHIAGSFKDGNETKRIEKDVEVYQVKRLTNPKGVWRSHDNNQSFNVTLLEAVNSNAESDFQPFISQGEWKAFIDEETNTSAGFSIRPNGQTNGYMENGVIHGNTGSEIHFAINFNQSVGENESKCAVVKVLYHGNQCMHKILVRKGYNAPLRMGGTKDDNSDGKLWSSFSLYQATKTGGTVGVDETFDAILTKNPLMLGSMFRRGRQDQGIFVWNNMQSNLGPFDPPYNDSFIVGQKKSGVTIRPDAINDTWKNQWEAKSWTNIGFRDDATIPDNRGNNLGIFYALDDNGNYTTDKDGNIYKYRVPTYAEFQALTDNSEFGFGVFYGSAATEPQKESAKAYGLIDPFNQGLFDDPNGMRAVVAYDKKSGNQILFPIGRYGIGVRRMYRWTLPGYDDANYYGQLKYSDLSTKLTFSNPNATTGNLFRPIPYNIPIVSGSIYWINVDVTGVHSGTGAATGTDRSCLGWDMNYFNFDFNAYTANNWQDACQIKFVIDE